MFRVVGGSVGCAEHTGDILAEKGFQMGSCCQDESGREVAAWCPAVVRLRYASGAGSLSGPVSGQNGIVSKVTYRKLVSKVLTFPAEYGILLVSDLTNVRNDTRNARGGRERQ